MHYNVAQLLKEPTGSTRTYQLQESFAGPNAVAESASGQVDMLRTHQGILLQAELEVWVSVTCSRCLNKSPRSVTMQMEEEFFPVIDVNTGSRLDIPAGAEGMTIDREHVLDLTEVLRQSVITYEPMKPLCSDDCLGLCQTCGVNRNQEECWCEDDQRDPRWGDLRELLRQVTS